jgi:hypothetical protein
MAVYPFSYLPDEFKGKRVLITGGFSQAPGVCTTIPGKRNSPKPPFGSRRGIKDAVGAAVSRRPHVVACEAAFTAVMLKATDASEE